MAALVVSIDAATVPARVVQHDELLFVSRYFPHRRGVGVGMVMVAGSPATLEWNGTVEPRLARKLLLAPELVRGTAANVPESSGAEKQ